MTELFPPRTHRSVGARVRRRAFDCSRAVAQALEARRLMCGDAHAFGEAVGSYDPIDPAVAVAPPAARAAEAGPARPLAALPILHSRSGAAAKLFLDFDGAPATTWGNYAVTATPAYTTDGDAATFTAGELAAVAEVWARVAEKYAPFDIDVTTQDPGSYADGVALRAVVGGNGAWIGPAGGVAYVHSFNNYGSYDLNTVYVFPANLGAGNAKFTSEAIAHEAGHAFGLEHQSSYSGTSKTNEYNPGTSAAAPVMGSSYSSTRGVWWNGPSGDGYNQVQNDMAVLADTNDTYSGYLRSADFGYRPDDHGGAFNAADAMTLSGTTVASTGVIERAGDADYFAFATGAGQVSFTLSVAPFGAMLDGRLTLTTAAGSVLLSRSTSSLGETLSTTLPAGSYRIGVSGTSAYGATGTFADVGQYALTGTIVAVADVDPPGAPTGLNASVQTGGVMLNWADNASDETSYAVDRTADGGATWTRVANAQINATAHLDASGDDGATYAYRVLAVRNSDTSNASNLATVTLAPATPGGLQATVAANAVGVFWQDVTGETGYRVERSADGGGTWSTAGTVGANVTALTDAGLAYEATYAYRVFATNAGGASGAGETVSATTVDPRPARPGAARVGRSGRGLAVTWDDVTGETGYRVDRSHDGGSTWRTVGQYGTNAARHAERTFSPGLSYRFRVTAYNATGDRGGAVAVLPPPVVTPSARVVRGLVNVSWKDVAGEEGYRVERLSGDAWVAVATLPAGAKLYADPDPAAGVRKYRVVAHNAGGDAAPSRALTVRVKPSRGVAPSQPVRDVWDGRRGWLEARAA